MINPTLFIAPALASLLMISSLAQAVDANKIWLPKSFSHVRPKLLAAANDAEQTERCVKVISGEMISRKNTADNYYFVITCRDAQRRSYNLTYLYPITGNTPQLKSEQRPQDYQQEEVVVSETGVNLEQAQTLCINELSVITDELETTNLNTAHLSGQQQDNGNFALSLDFTALSELGNDTSYTGNCQVSVQGDVTASITLQSAGALVICLDELRGESILLGRSSVIDNEIEPLPAVDHPFAFRIPFDVTARNSSPTRYAANCQVSAEGDASINIMLQAAGALAICKDTLLEETLLMKSVSIIDPPVRASHEDEIFAYQIGFTANDPEGNQRNFKASCEVTADGDAEVITEIDKDAIISVCINGVIEQTKRMLHVEVLHDDIPPLLEDGEGYIGIIPFNAKSPAGAALSYRGECRVDSSGRSKVQLKARR